MDINWRDKLEKQNINFLKRAINSGMSSKDDSTQNVCENHYGCLWGMSLPKLAPLI